MNGLRGCAAAAALLGAAAVVLGAFGAHALRGRLDAASLQIWHTAVDYQFWHTLALLAVCVLAPKPASVAWRITAAAFLIGIVLFSGSLYALALGAPRWTGLVTPFGGLALLAGWLIFAFALHRSRRT